MSETAGINVNNRLHGVLAPVVTPFDAQLRPDAGRLARHCRWLLDNDVSLAVFGTNSEANSMSSGEKIELLDRLIEAGLPPTRMMPGTGCCALTDSVELTRKAVSLGCAGVLMLPPFYYKGVSDDGLYRSYAEIIERVGDARLRIYLYHIPQVSGVAITLTLIERLLRDYPGSVAGLKDSSGDWDNTRAILEQFGPEGFDVFCGSESFLLATLRHGGKGSITATANVNPAPISRLYREHTSDDADAQQAALNTVRDLFQGYVMIPGMKAVIAHYLNDPEWSRVRPPLDEMVGVERERLVASLQRTGFEMPGLVG
ncbi:MAG: dihydrodipicolinate synthase family protein [Gammaproteobacteria bacterium]|nr:dihydrodipicolinate synthase family protein [Gammaproteobacteria bacterium]